MVVVGNVDIVVVLIVACVVFDVLIDVSVVVGSFSLIDGALVVDSRLFAFTKIIGTDEFDT